MTERARGGVCVTGHRGRNSSPTARIRAVASTRFRTIMEPGDPTTPDLLNNPPCSEPTNGPANARKRIPLHGAAKKNGRPTLRERWGNHGTIRQILEMLCRPDSLWRSPQVEARLGQPRVQFERFFECLTRLLLLSGTPQEHSKVVPTLRKIRQAAVETFGLVLLTTLLVRRS